MIPARHRAQEISPKNVLLLLGSGLPYLRGHSGSCFCSSGPPKEDGSFVSCRGYALLPRAATGTSPYNMH